MENRITKFKESFFKYIKSCVGSKKKLTRILATPIAVFLLSEYKNEMFNNQSTAIKDCNENKFQFAKPNKQTYVNTKFKYLILQIICGLKVPEDSEYIEKLSGIHPKRKLYYIMVLMNNGFLNLARLTALDLINHHIPCFCEKDQYDIYSRAAVISFLQGYNEEACLFWKTSGELRQTWQLPSTPRNYRIIGNDWFAAIGHVAMLDYYFKHKKLYGSGSYRFVVKKELKMNSLIKSLSRKFNELGLITLSENEIKADYDNWQKTNERIFWDELDLEEKESLNDDFWEHKFPDGNILGYAHAASRVQKDWERANYSPLLKVSEEETKWLHEYKAKIGLPEDAWYVCLHVREAGYYKSWNKLYPTIRDAKIETYYKAVEKITSAGGWVIRMGDPSMQPIAAMPNVIDYAHSPFRRSLADLLFPATCEFFIGTNSGYATIPVIFGTPCALTNWVPIGWPLWPSQDLMIFKLFREKKTNRYLSLEELFDKRLAFIQNISDIATDLEVVDNTPEEICQLTSEMLEACVLKKRSLKEVGAQPLVMEAYEALAKKYGTFTGSRLSRFFVEQHPQVFNCLKRNKELKFDVKDEMTSNTL